jgi:malonyl CoA-acyl carrier protein transacylase
MGAELFDTVHQYASIEKNADALLGFSVRELCRDDPGGRLRETQYTQPALFTVNALHYFDALAKGATAPNYLAGHSLGEYNALLAAGVFDFETGLRLVKKRGELMARARNGAMAAVLGPNAESVARVCRENGLAGIDIANVNSPSQTVLSGPAEAIQRAAPIFEAAADVTLYAPLSVSGAFHSRHMKSAAEEFAAFLAPFSFNAPRIPVIANATGAPYPVSDTSHAVKSLLIRQIAQPVLWLQCVRHMIERGVTRFKELGPGNVLTRLIEQTGMLTQPSASQTAPRAVA